MHFEQGIVEFEPFQQADLFAHLSLLELRAHQQPRNLHAVLERLLDKVLLDIERRWTELKGDNGLHLGIRSLACLLSVGGGVVRRKTLAVVYVARDLRSA